MKLLFLLMLVAGDVWGTTWYVDPTCATPGDGTTTTCSGGTAPVDQFGDLTVIAGDTVSVKSGTTVTDAFVQASKANLTLNIYGGTAPATIDCANTLNYGVSATQTDEITIQDINIKQCKINNILLITSSATQMDAYVTRVWAGDMSVAQSSNWVTGTSFYAQTASGTVGRLNVTYTDVSCSNVTSHCFEQYNEVYATYTRASCNGAGIGRAYGAHCFTAHPRIQTWTNSWTLSSGTTYYRNRVFSGDAEYSLCGRGGTISDFCAVKQTADDTSLSAGEWATWANAVGSCVNGAGCVAVNFGFDPNLSAGNFSATYLGRYQNGATYKDVTATGSLSSTGGAEGDGIVCDDFTANCVIGYGTRAYSNERNGIQLRQTTGARLNSFITHNNGLYGTLLQGTLDTQVSNFANHGNAQGLRVLTDYDRTVVLKNGVNSANTAKNWSVDPQAVAQVTQTNNVSYAGGAADDNFTATLTSNPLYIGGTSPTTAAGFRTACGSPLIATGTNLGPMQDYGNRRFSAIPSIGAWEHASGDAQCTVTAR